jgi:hypothetical protein
MNKIKIRKSIMLLSKIRHNVYKNYKNKSNFKKLMLIYKRYNKLKNIHNVVNIFVLIKRGRFIINANLTVSIKYPYPKDFSELNTDCYNAQAGDIITLLPNTNYYGNLYITNKHGTADNYIKIIGDDTSAIIGALDPIPPNSDGFGPVAIKLTNCSYIYIGKEPTVNTENGKGFQLTTAKKGLYADNCSYITIQNLNIHNIGMEALHILNNSSFCNIYNNRIYNTGLGTDLDPMVNDAKFGEGIYVGSAYDNWAVKTIADETHDINIRYNYIYNTTAECIDVKEGTYNGLIESNYFNGEKLSSEYADSWIDIKGTLWNIYDNEGYITLTNGFQIHAIDTGSVDTHSGWNNVIYDNCLNCLQPNGSPCLYYAIEIASDTCGNIVYDNNIAYNTNKGLCNSKYLKPTP